MMTKGLVHHGMKTFSLSSTGNASPRRCDALRKVCGILRDPSCWRQNILDWTLQLNNGKARP